MPINLVNLTSHDIIDTTTYTVIPQSKMVARVDMQSTIAYTINNIPVYTMTLDRVTGIPEPQPNTVYIVSSLCLDMMRQNNLHRDDVVCPGRAEKNKDTKAIIGCRGFRQ
jgi:hypothetical protein